MAFRFSMLNDRCKRKEGRAIWGEQAVALEKGESGEGLAEKQEGIGNSAERTGEMGLVGTMFEDMSLEMIERGQRREGQIMIKKESR